MHAGLDAETPRRQRQFLVTRKIGLHHGRVRPARMQVDRHIEPSAQSKMHQNFFSSRKLSPERPLIIAPLKPSLLIARSSSLTAAGGSAVGSAARPAKRSGCALVAA